MVGTGTPVVRTAAQVAQTPWAEPLGHLGAGRPRPCQIRVEGVIGVLASLGVSPYTPPAPADAR
jgi:hypothetical protein